MGIHLSLDEIELSSAEDGHAVAQASSKASSDDSNGKCDHEFCKCVASIPAAERGVMEDQIGASKARGKEVSEAGSPPKLLLAALLHRQPLVEDSVLRCLVVK